MTLTSNIYVYSQVKNDFTLSTLRQIHSTNLLKIREFYSSCSTVELASQHYLNRDLLSHHWILSPLLSSFLCPSIHPSFPTSLSPPLPLCLPFFLFPPAMMQVCNHKQNCFHPKILGNRLEVNSILI